MILFPILIDRLAIGKFMMDQLSESWRDLSLGQLMGCISHRRATILSLVGTCRLFFGNIA